MRQPSANPNLLSRLFIALLLSLFVNQLSLFVDAYPTPTEPAGVVQSVTTDSSFYSLTLYSDATTSAPTSESTVTAFSDYPVGSLYPKLLNTTFREEISTSILELRCENTVCKGYSKNGRAAACRIYADLNNGAYNSLCCAYDGLWRARDDESGDEDPLMHGDGRLCAKKPIYCMDYADRRSMDSEWRQTMAELSVLNNTLLCPAHRPFCNVRVVEYGYSTSAIVMTTCGPYPESTITSTNHAYFLTESSEDFLYRTSKSTATATSRKSSDTEDDSDPDFATTGGGIALISVGCAISVILALIAGSICRQWGSSRNLVVKPDAWSPSSLVHPTSTTPHAITTESRVLPREAGAVSDNLPPYGPRASGEELLEEGPIESDIFTVPDFDSGVLEAMVPLEDLSVAAYTGDENSAPPPAYSEY